MSWRTWSLFGFCGMALLSAGFSTLALAEVVITPKHLVILRPGVDTVWGSYVFAVQNDGQEPARLKTQIMLPKETSDFMPQEGLSPEQLTLSDSGVTIDAEFPNGVHIISIGFKVDGRFGLANLTFAPVVDVQSFTVLIPRDGSLTVSSPLLQKADDGASPDPQYESMLAKEPLVVGNTYALTVGGLPEGRARIWIVGAVVGVMMALLAALMAIRTRPKITGDAGETVLVG